MSKTVLVTGASSGIGAATVRLFRERGWDVIGVARRTEKLEALAAETGAEVFTADLTAASDVEALVTWLADRPVHALINNAGGAIGVDPIEDADPDDWRQMFEVNVIAVQRVIKALLPLLRRGAQDAGFADILTVTSIAGHLPYEGGGGYNATKFAAHGMMGVLRLELVGEPIRVLEIAPGMVMTDEFSVKRFGGDAQKAAAVYEGVEKPLTAEDIAQTIVLMIELPGHVNLDFVTIKPVAQAAPHKVVRAPLRPRL